MKDGNSRFDALFGAAKQGKGNEQSSDIQTSKQVDAQMSKSKDPDFQRTTIYMPRTLHRRFKAAVAIRDEDMSDIVTLLVEQWLERES